jgi:hypothetical protein
LSVALVVLMPGTVVADAVSVPSGTRVFIELEQRVTSKKKHNQPGSFVAARIWRDVVVDGHTVVNAGAPVMVQIGEIKGAKVAGVKGFVELKAKQVTAVDGSDVMLTGGYDRSGSSLIALSVTLAVVVFVPLIFIKGKQAKLEPGTIFDAMVYQATSVGVGDAQPAKITLADSKPLTVEVLYERLDSNDEGRKEVKDLPMHLTVEGNVIGEARVVKVNDATIEPIPISVGEATVNEDGRIEADGTVRLKALGNHFTEGFNRFTIEVNGFTADVMLDLEF